MRFGERGAILRDGALTTNPRESTLHSIRAGSRRLVHLAVLASALAAVGLLHAAPASAQTPIVPENGGLYPLLTPMTGPCKEAPRTGESREHTFSKFIWASDRDPLVEPDGTVWPYAVVAPRAEWRHGGDSFEPCEASESGSFGEARGRMFRPSDSGDFIFYAYKQRSRWLFDDQDCFCWVHFEDFPLQRIFTREFKVYDPCNYLIGAASGRVLITRNGKVLAARPGSDGPGAYVMRGDLLTVQNEGKRRGEVSLQGDVNSFKLGPGEYRLSDNAECEKVFERGQVYAKLPKQPADVEIKEGVIEQRIDEIGSTIKAGKELKVDGIFSNLVPDRAPQAGAAAEVPPRFKLTRKKKTTKVCAKKGRVRLRTTSKKVAKKKRKLVIEAGQCAKAKDGKAPKRLGKKKRKR
jgi:hypothetical protein